MTPLEQFKLGFLTRCAEEGLSPEAAQARIAQAERTLTQTKEADVASTLASGTAYLGGLGAKALAAPAVMGPLAVGGAGVAGMGLGYLSRKAELANPIDVEDVQKQELIQAYLLHRRRILDEMRAAPQKNQRGMALEEGF